MDFEDNNNYKPVNGRRRPQNGLKEKNHKLSQVSVSSNFESKQSDSILLSSTPKSLTPITGSQRSENSSDDEEISRCSFSLTKNGSYPGYIFEFYNSFDQYWNVFPKTDYTYSPSSPYNGQHVAPGVPVVPNMSRRTLRSDYLRPNPYRDGVASKLRFTPKSRLSRLRSTEEEENFKNLQKVPFERTKWERTKDAWSALWYFIYTVVTTIITTTVTTTSTITGPLGISGDHVSPLNASNRTSFWRLFSRILFPLLLFLLIFLCRESLTKLWEGGAIEVEGTASGPSATYRQTYLLAPLYSLLGFCTSTCSLVLSSLAMIPTIAVQLMSLMWSVVLFPLQGFGGFFWNATLFSQEASPPPMSPSHHAEHLISLKDSKITIEDIRRIVIEIMDERRPGEDNKLYLDNMLVGVNNKINFNYDVLMSQIREAVREVRKEEDARMEGLKGEVMAKVEEAKARGGGATLEEVRPLLVELMEENYAGDSERLEALIVKLLGESESLMVRREQVEEYIKQVVEKRGETWGREMKAATEVSIQQALLAWSDNTLNVLLADFKIEMEKLNAEKDLLSARLNHLEEGSKSIEEISAQLSDLHKLTLHSIQNRLRKLEVLSSTRDMLTTNMRVVGGVETGGLVLNSSSSVVWRDVQNYVQTVLSKYHADRTAMPDFALQTSGAYIVSIRCTITYPIAGKKYFLGFPLWDEPSSPDSILKPGIMPGQCWGFVGSEGYVVIKLSAKVKVSSFAMEHTPRELSIHGHIKSAPHHFSVWGLNDENDPDPIHLGSFAFLDNGETLQAFPAKEVDRGFDMVELKVESNHGHLEYTCVYRFRVHGISVPA